MIREFISLIFFNTALGNSFYENLNFASLLKSSLFFIFLTVFFFNLPKINNKIFLLSSWLLSMIVSLNVLRYKPFGGDAVIYCEINELIKDSSISIYDLPTKYSFNYPPIYKYLIEGICSFDYISLYPYISILVLLIILPKTNNNFSDFAIYLLYFLGAFLALRWVFKTGNFVFIELLTLHYFLKSYIKKREINYFLLFLFGFQRLWFLLIIPFLFILEKNKVEKLKSFSLPILFVLFLNLFEIDDYLSSFFQLSSSYSIFSEQPGHNTPSLYLGVLKLVGIESGIYTLSIYFLIILYLLKLLTIKKIDEKTLFLIFSFFLIFNPYLKPYHMIFMLPLIQLLDLKFLKSRNAIFISIFAPNFLWILGSNIGLGTYFGFFQIIFPVAFIYQAYLYYKKESKYD